MKNSVRLLILGPILAGLLAGGCAFKKGSGDKPSSNEIVQVVQKDDIPKETPVDIWETLKTADSLEIIRILDTKSIEEIKGLRSPNNENVLDIIAQRNLIDVIVYLVNDGYSPFDILQNASNNTMERYQNDLLDKIKNAALNDSTNYFNVLVKKYDLQKTVCKKTLSDLEEARVLPDFAEVLTDEPKTDTDKISRTDQIRNFFENPICKIELQNISTEDKERLISSEYRYQYRENFQDYDFFVFLAMTLGIRNFQFEGVSPELLLRAKEKCVSKELLSKWQELLEKIIGLQKTYSVDYVDPFDMSTIEGRSYFIGLSDEEKAKLREEEWTKKEAEALKQLYLDQEPACK